MLLRKPDTQTHNPHPLSDLGRVRFLKEFSHAHLPGDDCYLWDGGLCVGVQQFGSVADDAPVLLSSTCGLNDDTRVAACIWSVAGMAALKITWQEARHVYESDDRDVEGVAEANEPRSLHRGVDVQTA